MVTDETNTPFSSISFVLLNQAEKKWSSSAANTEPLFFLERWLWGPSENLQSLFTRCLLVAKLGPNFRKSTHDRKAVESSFQLRSQIGWHTQTCCPLQFLQLTVSELKGQVLRAVNDVRALKAVVGGEGGGRRRQARLLIHVNVNRTDSYSTRAETTF